MAAALICANATPSIGFYGVGAHDGLTDGIADFHQDKSLADIDDWHALRARWNTELCALTAEIRSGLASVTPKHPQDTCRNCDLSAVCRIREHLAWGDDADAGEGA